MMATVPHVTSGLGLRKFQADRFLLTRVYILFLNIYGRDCAVVVVTCYGMDGPSIKSRVEQDFPHPSRPALRPAQSPIQGLWVLSQR